MLFRSSSSFPPPPLLLPSSSSPPPLLLSSSSPPPLLLTQIADLQNEAIELCNTTSHKDLTFSENLALRKQNAVLKRINQELSKKEQQFESIITQLEKVKEKYWDNEVNTKELEEKLEGVEIDWKVKDLIEEHINLIKTTYVLNLSLLFINSS